MFRTELNIDESLLALAAADLDPPVGESSQLPIISEPIVKSCPVHSRRARVQRPLEERSSEQFLYDACE